jgi:hypothetical protein
VKGTNLKTMADATGHFKMTNLLWADRPSWPRPWATSHRRLPKT